MSLFIGCAACAFILSSLTPVFFIATAVRAEISAPACATSASAVRTDDRIVVGESMACYAFGAEGQSDSDSPSLGVHVAHIVSVSPEEEVRRIDAQRIVAVMKAMESWRDGAVVNLPRHAVRLIGSPAYGNLTIASRSEGCGPDPAVSRLINMTPETNFNREWCGGHRIPPEFDPARSDGGVSGSTGSLLAGRTEVV